MKIIGVDIDGVIADSFPVIVELAQGAFGRHVGPEVWRWKLMEIYDITLEEELKFWEEVEGEIYRRTLPLSGAQAALRTLQDKGCALHYITARSPQYRSLTEDWLASHGFPAGSLTFTENKGQACQRSGVEVFFEDSPHFVGDGYPPTFLFDYPYNRHVSHPTITRVTAWPEALSKAMATLRIG